MDAFRDDSGRVHLTVRRDPATGSDRLALSARLFELEWQDQVALGAANTVLGILGREPTLGGILELTRRVMASTARLVDGMLAQSPGDRVACRAGCDHCCHVVVGVTAPEALAIFHHLQRSFSPSELAGLSSRVAELLERTRGLSSSERFSPEYPCVFLDGGRCSIYEVRPLACRGMNSLDEKECETRLRDPIAREAFAAHGGGRLFVEPVRAFHAVSAGLQLSLSELYHLDMRPLELTSAMHVLFQGGGSVVASWLVGQHAFDAALCDTGAPRAGGAGPA